MEKLGMSIKDILKRMRKHFSLKCTINLGINILNLLERMHSIGYIHCDIKPDNIMIGNFTSEPKLINKLYMIDFGIT